MISASYVFLCERLNLTLPEFRRKGACWESEEVRSFGTAKVSVDLRAVHLSADQRSKTVIALKGNCRWALTKGTPQETERHVR
jgi:hypothetical protein